MQSIDDTSVIAYRDQVVLELVGTVKDGENGAVSYQFDRGETASGILEPKSPIQNDHREAVTAALHAEGFQLVSDPS